MVIKDTYASKFVEKKDMGICVPSSNPKDISDLLSSILQKDLSISFDPNGKFIWEKQEREFIRIYSSITN